MTDYIYTLYITNHKNTIHHEKTPYTMKKPCTMHHTPWQHHTHGNTIPMKTPYPWKHHTHDNTIPMTTPYPWKHHTHENTIYPWKHHTHKKHHTHENTRNYFRCKVDELTDNGQNDLKNVELTVPWRNWWKWPRRPMKMAKTTRNMCGTDCPVKKIMKRPVMAWLGADSPKLIINNNNNE